MISQTSEYALRAVAFLASLSDGPVSRREIAEATCVPNDYLTKVLRELDRAGIVKARRGPGGGYTLLVSPEKTSVYDVISVVEEIPRIKECPLGIEGHANLCPLHRRLDDAAAMVEQAFRQTRISEILPTQSGSKRSCAFPIS